MRTMNRFGRGDMVNTQRKGKHRATVLSVLFPLLILGLSSCGSDSSSGSGEAPSAGPFLDIGPDSLGIVMDSDTVRVYWSGQMLVVNADRQFPADSLNISYRVTGSLEWLSYITFPLTDFPHQYALINSQNQAFTVDFQLTLFTADGQHWTADSAYGALNARQLQPTSSSSMASSSSGSSGYDYTVSSGMWGGDLPESYGDGQYVLKLKSDGLYEEWFIDAAEDGECLEIHGSWQQKRHEFALTPAREYRNPKMDGGCPTYIGGGTALDRAAAHYAVVFQDASGQRIYLTVPGIGSMHLSAD